MEVLLEGGADPELGSPNAVEACRVFGLGEWEGWMVERVRERKEKEGEGKNRGEEVDGS